MSFAIAAIYKDRDVYIATDSQMTNQFTGMTWHNANKIAEINKSVGIAYTGTVSFCEQVISSLVENYSATGYIPALQSDIAKDISDYTKKLLPVWMKENLNFEPEAAFFVAGYNVLNSPGITTIILHQKSVIPYNKGWQAGDYRFSVAIPQDIRVDDCIQLCTQFLSHPDNRGQDPEATLGRLVELISRHSDAVDDLPKVWKAGRDYWPN